MNHLEGVVVDLDDLPLAEVACFRHGFFLLWGCLTGLDPDGAPVRQNFRRTGDNFAYTTSVGDRKCRELYGV